MAKKLAAIIFTFLLAHLSAFAQQSANATTVDTRKIQNSSAQAQSAEEAAIQSQISSVYQNFLSSYRLGAGDVVAIYVDKHPDDSLQRAVVSPVGQVYYPLMGNVTVAGKTITQLQDFFTTSISEFIKDPKVTLSLLEANSAKVGVLGDVRSPGVILLARPMRILDVITAAGGITDLGSSSNVSVLRQFEDGRTQTFTVNVKKILQGKAGPEENAFVRTGDTIIVHGNTFKAISKISSMVGITGLITFITRGGR
jgi:polysaccharide export outer membrane protein